MRHTHHTPIHFCRVLSATHLSLIALYVLVDHLSAAGLSLHYCPCRVVFIGAFVGRPPPPKGLGLGVLLKAAKFIGAGKRRLASHWQWSACVPCQYLQMVPCSQPLPAKISCVGNNPLDSSCLLTVTRG